MRFMFMKIFPALILLFCFGKAWGQKKDCYCDKDTLMNGATVDCTAVLLKNNAKLYWQYNCDRIWLTLENSNGKKMVLDDMDVTLYAYTYRLGYQLVKEYQHTLLFRSGCPANGPCIYTLIDKETGRTVDTFDQLICIDTDSQWEEAYEYPYDFVVYFSEDAKSLKVQTINRKKIGTFPFDAVANKLTSVIPEHQFNKMVLVGDILVLDYIDDTGKNQQLKLKLSNKK